MAVNQNTLDLSNIVDVVVEISPLAAPRATFNEMLVVGPTVVIPTSERVRLYQKPADMLKDGFDEDDPEYQAALIYFAQSPAPRNLWVGCQDLLASPPESPLDALEACRAINYDWYTCIVVGSGKVDHLEIALWAQSAVPSTVYGFTTQDVDVPSGTAQNIFASLKALSYNHVIGQYATDQGAVYPNNVHAIAGILGYAMGQNTGLANSAYTLKFKEEVGITTEPLTPSEVAAIEGDNGNVYLSYGNYYNMFEQGKMANGQFFDEIINLDMLVNNIQLTVMDLLYGTPKIPQTEPGQAQIIHACNQACEQAVIVGFLAPGIWTGVEILNLKQGDVLSKGYLCQSPAYSTQTDAKRQARESMPVYIAIKEAGAVHSVLIGVYVNR